MQSLLSKESLVSAILETCLLAHIEAEIRTLTVPDEDIVERNQSAKSIITNNPWAGVMEKVFLLFLIDIQTYRANMAVLQGTIMSMRLDDGLSTF